MNETPHPFARPGDDRVRARLGRRAVPGGSPPGRGRRSPRSARRTRGTSPRGRGRRPRASCRTLGAHSGRRATVRLSSRLCRAKIRASQHEPSFHSPSDVRQKTRPGSSFSRFARVSPQDSERPCPRLPVANRISSIPEVGGWPLSRVPSLWNCRRSSSAELPERPEGNIVRPAECPLESTNWSTASARRDGERASGPGKRGFRRCGRPHSRNASATAAGRTVNEVPPMIRGRLAWCVFRSSVLNGYSEFTP